MNPKTILFSLSLALLCSSLFAQTGSIEVTVMGLENSDGVIQIGLYNAEKDFPESDKVYKGAIPKANQSGTVYTFTSLPAGTYAIAVYHDEDADQKMKKNMFGVPKEKYGFSNNKFGTFGPPDYEDVSFKVVDNETTKLSITLK